VSNMDDYKTPSQAYSKGPAHASAWGGGQAAQERARSNLLDLALEEVEIGRIERIHALRSMFGTSGGPSTQALAALAEHIMPVRIPRGTQLAREGSLLGIVYLIIEGKIVASRHGHPWGEFAAPGSIGFLPALAGGMQGIDCRAVEDTIALALRSEDMLEVLEDHFDLLLGAMRGFARSAIELRRQLMPSAGFSNELRETSESLDGPLDLVERILHLRQSFALQRSFVAEISEIARAAQEARYAPGTQLWSVGDVADHAVILLGGVVDCDTPDGARFSFGPGDIIGNLDTMASAPRWFNAVTREPVVALVLHAEVMVDVLEDHAELAFDFLRMFSAGLVDLRERVHERAQLEGTTPKPTWTGPRPQP
jgi:CRP-like cAMP-binding protein